MLRLLPQRHSCSQACLIHPHKKRKPYVRRGFAKRCKPPQTEYRSDPLRQQTQVYLPTIGTVLTLTAYNELLAGRQVAVPCALLVKNARAAVPTGEQT